MVEGHRWPGAEINSIPACAPRANDKGQGLVVEALPYSLSHLLRALEKRAPRLDSVRGPSRQQVRSKLPGDGADARAQQLLRRNFRTYVGRGVAGIIL